MSLHVEWLGFPLSVEVVPTSEVDGSSDPTPLLILSNDDAVAIVGTPEGWRGLAAKIVRLANAANPSDDKEVI